MLNTSELEEKLPSIASRQSTGVGPAKNRPHTLGFPALRTESKKVTFTHPLDARCVALDESWSIDCQVLRVWDDGARLFVPDPLDVTRFFLIFVSSPKLVLRRCKRVWVRGNELEVSYERQRPCFALERNPLNEKPARLLDL